MALPSLLVVVGDLQNDAQKENVSKYIVEGLKTCSLGESCNVNDEVRTLASLNPPINRDESGAQFLHHKSATLETRVLLQPTLASLEAALIPWMTAPSRALLFSGPVTSSQGHWVLQDAIFTPPLLLHHLLKTGQQPDDAASEVKESGDAPSVSVHVACPVLEGDWKTLLTSKTPGLTITLNAGKTEPTGDDSGLIQFATLIQSHLSVESVEARIEPSDVTGSVQFSKPTLYVFPEGDGDSCLIGVEGFNLLVNAGIKRTPTCWSFAKHINRIDAFLQTHWTADNIRGVSNLLDRKAASPAGPPIGMFMAPPGPNRIKTHILPQVDSLYLSPYLHGNAIHASLAKLEIPNTELASPKLAAFPKPITLYSKVGHGSLDLYPMNPVEDDTDLKKFLDEWTRLSHTPDTSHPSGAPKLALGLASAASLCCAIVWRPCRPMPPTRFLLTGACHQHHVIQMAALLTVKVNDFKTCDGLPVKALPPASQAGTKAAPPAGAQRAQSKTSLVPKSTPASKPAASKPTSAATPAKKPESNGTAKPAVNGPTKATNGKPAASKPAPSAAPKSATPRQPSAKTPAAPPPTKKAPASSGDQKKVKKEVIAPVPATPTPDVDQGALTSAIDSTTKLLSPSGDAGESSKEGGVGAGDDDTQHEVSAIDDDTFSLNSGGPVAVETMPGQEVTPQGLPDPVPSMVKCENDDTESGEHELGLPPCSLPGLSDPDRPTSATVECAIPEGGEADYHAESPQQLTADQLREMGVLEDDEEDQPDAGAVKDPQFDPVANWGNPQELPAPKPADVETVPTPAPEPSDPGTPADSPADGASGASDTALMPPPTAIDPAATKKKPTSKQPSSIPSKDTKKPLASARPATNGSRTNLTPRPNTAPATKKKLPETQTPAKTTPRDSKPGPDSSKRPRPSASPAVSLAPGATQASLFPNGSTKAPYDKLQPAYFDMVSVPCHGDSRMVDVEFFKRIRSRYYLLSALDPPVTVLEALVVAKEHWKIDNNSGPEVTLIPTYDSLPLLQWISANKDRLAKARVEIAPAAVRCPIQLQDHDSVCSAYRVEF